MDFRQSEEQKDLRATVRRLFQGRATPEALSEIEASDDAFHAELWSELADLGLLGVSTPEELGGAGLGIEELMVVVEEVGAGVPAVPFVSSVAIAAPTVEAFGSAEQKSRLRDHAAGKHIYTVSGVNPADNQPPLVASRNGDGWSLTGACSLVPFGPVADSLLVPAVGDEGTAVFVVDLQGPGVHLERQRATSREVRALVHLEDSEAEPLGNPSHGADALSFLETRAQLAWCGFTIGLATRAIELTAGYTRERKQFGVPIGSFQAVAQRIADAYIELEVMRLSLARAIYQVGAGEDASEALAVASYWCAEGVHNVTYACQHLHGGVGVDRTYPLFRYYLHGRQVALALGGAQSRLAEIGDLLASS
jgi:alkylation response protein AidB-like acyl-CoA dehydrogenase